MAEINFNQTSIYNFNNLGLSMPITPGNQVNDILSDLFKSLSGLFESLGSSRFELPNGRGHVLGQRCVGR